MNLENRYPIAASLYSQHEMSQRLKITNRGHQLLRRKVEALKIRQRSLAKELVKCHEEIIVGLKEAFISLAAAKYSNGDIGPFVIENTGEAKITVALKNENLAGVNLQTFECIESGVDSFQLTGLSTGGHQLSEAKQNFRQTLQTIISMAAIRYSFGRINQSLGSAIRKVNATEKIIIPRIQNTLAYIQTELDENEREEFFRLKKIKNKKLLAKSLVVKDVHTNYVNFRKKNYDAAGESSENTPESSATPDSETSTDNGPSDSGDVSKNCRCYFSDEDDILF